MHCMFLSIHGYKQQQDMAIQINIQTLKVPTNQFSRLHQLTCLSNFMMIAIRSKQIEETQLIA